MNELIKIQEHNGKKAVSARDLYDFLDVETPFHKWIPRMLEYGFEENQDWTKMSSDNQHYNTEYALSIDCAKQIAMIQRTPKGKQAREYFIEVEKKYQSGYTTLNSISRKDLARMLYEAEEAKEKLEEENQKKTLALKEAIPKIVFADAVTASESSILVGELAKILKQNGIEIGQNRLFEWLRKNEYLCSRGELYNQPTQKAMELGLFEIKKTTINPPDGPIFVSVTTKVTTKGQMYFVNKFLKAQW